MRIEPLHREHVRAVATLHCASLQGLLTELGPVAARSYYAACVDEPLCVALVAVDDDGVRGFVLGSRTPAALKPAIVRRHPLRIAGAIALGILRRPIAMRWLAESFRARNPEPFDTSAPELIYLSSGLRRQGIGRQLVDAFSEKMRLQGAARYELSVDEDNPSAVAFYERAGFARIGSYAEFGRKRLRFALELPR